MLLAIDIGNTNIGFAVYAEGQVAPAGNWRIRTDRERTPDEHGLLMRDLLKLRGVATDDITSIAISSVVPSIITTFFRMAAAYFTADMFVVDSAIDTGIKIHYEPASDVGADRICNAVGAFSRYGGPLIVVDYGTATTFDAIGRSGDYLGGAILPGISISMDALFRQAARLHRVELEPPPHAVGINTVHAMQSGLVFGFAGQTDAMVERFRQEIGRDARVIATGGLAELMRGASSTIEEVDEMVTLEGLRLLWKRSRHA